MITPTIHMNGTSANELLDQLQTADMKLREAYEALCQSAPHSRDYYVQKGYPKSYETAREAHFSRLQAVDGVRKQLHELANAIQDQRHSRVK